MASCPQYYCFCISPEFFFIFTFTVQRCFILFCLNNNFKRPFDSIWFHNNCIFSCPFTSSLFRMPVKSGVHQQTQMALVQVLSFCILKHYNILDKFSPAFPTLLQKLFYYFLVLSTSFFSLNSSTAIPPSYHQT